MSMNSHEHEQNSFIRRLYEISGNEDGWKNENTALVITAVPPARDRMCDSQVSDHS